MICRLDGKCCLFVIMCALVFSACLGISVRAQGAEQSWENAAGGKQQFEVASVRENKAGGDSNSNFTLDGNGNAYWVMDKDVKTAPEGSLFRATNQTLMRYIIFAYKLNGTEELALRVHQCPECTAWAGLGLDLPAWVANTRYDIEARASAGATKDQMRLMMQSLLAERFKLAVHKETRQAPVFALALEKPGTSGPQLRAHPESDTCATTVFPDAAGVGADEEKNGGQKSAAGTNRSQTLPIPCGIIARLPPSAPWRHRIGGRNVTLAMVAESLPAQTGLATFPKPVIDRTGLSGTFDFSLEWTQAVASDMAVGPNAQGEEPGPSIAQAIKQQLGLKLESTKGSVELLVIDHVEQPTAN
jgi:uncharacterized protein (TIGR03435 family)